MPFVFAYTALKLTRKPAKSQPNPVPLISALNSIKKEAAKNHPPAGGIDLGSLA